MTVHYLPNRNGSRIARLEALLRKGMPHADALRAVDMTAYDVVQELKKLPPVESAQPQAPKPAILPFPKRNETRRPHKLAAKLDHNNPYETLQNVLSFPAVQARHYDRRI